MATKIYVSQIDTANTTGGQAPLGSLIVVGSNGPYWSNADIYTITGINPGEIVGYTGSRGATGYQGSTGSQGITGFSGSVGGDGAQGAVGYSGSAGPGYTGSAGNVGYSGSLGATGYFGSLGYFGSEGYFGSVGYRGSLGATGYRGSLGATGYRGSVGYMGSSGSMIFTNILDVPQAYTGKAGAVVRVNSTASGLFFDGNTYLTSTIATTLTMSGNTISSPSIQGYSEVVNAKGNSTDTVFITVSDGNVQTITLNAAIVDIVMQTTGLVSGQMYTVTLLLKQDATGGRIVDWTNQTIYWPSSEGIYAPEGPSLSTSPNYTDFITLITLDGGSSWYGLLSGKGFATT